VNNENRHAAHTGIALIKSHMKIVSTEFIKSATAPSHYPEDGIPDIAFVGRSNVGKSSLINTLLNRKSLARVSNTPGRTQLINFFKVNNEFFLVDLPGYGFAKVPEAIKRKWGPMVETYLKERRSLSLVVVILDARRTPSKEDMDLVSWLQCYNIPRLFVLTKTDKISNNEIRNRQVLINKFLGLTQNTVLFSAKTGRGKEDIWKAIKDILEEPSATT
jgi:GTP-binding protein